LDEYDRFIILKSCHRPLILFLPNYCGAFAASNRTICSRLLRCLRHPQLVVIYNSERLGLSFFAPKDTFPHPSLMNPAGNAICTGIYFRRAAKRKPIMTSRINLCHSTFMAHQRFWGAERIRRLLFYAVFMGAWKIRLMANSIVQSMTKDAVAKTAIRVQANGREIRK